MADSKIKGITVVINGETTQLSRALSSLDRQTKAMKASLRDVNKLLKLDPTSFSTIARKQELLNDSISAYQKKIGALTIAERAMYENRANWTASEREEYTKLRKRLDEAELKYAELTEEAKRFGNAASTSVLAAQAQYAALGDTLIDLGKKLAVLSASTALIGGYSIYAAAKYESAFAGVRKTVDATEAEFQDLSDTIREMALTKPIDATDIAYAAELGGQLGIAVENLDQFASVIADLDVATNLDLEDASMKLAQFANIASIGEDNFDRLGSTIVDLGNNSATTESKIMNMAMRIAGSGSNIGLSAQEILALATSLASVGIEAEMGGNAISTIMNRIDKDVALNTETLQVWADTAGMSVEEFAAAWDTPETVMSTFMAVVDGMATYRDEGGNLNTLLADMNISYMRQIDTMQRLSRTGDIVNDMVGIANNAWDENIALTREANRRYETTENQLKLVKNNFKEIAIQLGEIMTPSLKEFSGDLVEVLQDFQNLDESTKRSIVGFLGFATAAGPATLALGALAKGLSGLIGLYSKGITNLALLTRGTATFAGAADAVAAATARAEAKTKLLNTALSTASMLAGIAIVAGLALTVKGIKDTIKREEDLIKATFGLSDALDVMDDSVNATADSIASIDADPAVREFGELRDSIEEAIEEQALFAEEVKETWQEIDGQEYALESYLATIEELTSKTDANGNAVKLTAEEQRRLYTAVEMVNDICGTNYEVIDAQMGKISASTDVIKANTDAWILNAKAQALTEQIGELAVQEALAKDNRDSAYAAWQNAKAEQAEMTKPGSGYTAQEIADHGAEVIALEEEYNRAQSALAAASTNLDRMEGLLGEVTEAYASSTAELAEFIDSSETWSKVLSDMGIDTDNFVIKLSEMGFTAADMRGMTEEQIRLLASTFGLSVEEIIAAFEGAGVEVPEAVKRAMDEAVAETDREDEFYQAGQNALRGLLNGFSLSTNLGRRLSERFSTVGTDLLNTFRAATGEGSPWKTMIQSGRFANEGLAIGLDRYSYISEGSAASLGSRTLSAIDRSLGSNSQAAFALSLDSGGASRSASAGGSPSTTNYYMIDGAVVNSTPEIENAFYGFMAELKRLGVMQGGN